MSTTEQVRPAQAHSGAKLSARMSDCKSSPLRDIFTAIEKPGMISFAGGLPATETFNGLEKYASSESSVVAQMDIYQYGASHGEVGLRELIANDICKSGLAVTPEQILILSGSQQGIDLAAKLLVDQGTKVSLVYPTYLAALQSFSLFGAEYIELDIAPEGIDLDKASAVYINPTFANPTGRCLDEEERTALAAACDRNSVVLIEDDAYRELFYTDCCRKPVSASLESSSWIYLSSFSKTIAPGLRVGYMAVCRELLPLIISLKQAADLHTCRLAQSQVMNLLNSGDYQTRLCSMRDLYCSKRNNFNQLLLKYFADFASWQLPQGGMFFWVRLNNKPKRPLPDLLQLAIESGVAFMPGSCFYPDSATNMEGDQLIRLNFTCVGENEAAIGLAVLAQLFSSQTP